MSGIQHREAGQGRTLVLIHGFCETRAIWDDLAVLLARQFKVIVPDLPGFGNSAPLADEFSLDDVATALLEWIQPWKDDAPVVIGHSLGGYVTLAMARKQPSLFAGIGLFHSTAYADTTEKKNTRNKVIDFVDHHGVAAYVDTYVPGLFYQKDHPAIQLVHAIAAATRSETLTAYAAAMRDRKSSVGVIKEFQRPVLFVAGDHDSIIPAEQLREQAAMTPLPVFESLSDTGHMGMFENESKACLAIGDFVRLATKTSL